MSLTENPKFNYEFEWQINPHPGFFVVVEGLDGSGNSTQIEKLVREYFYDWEGITDRHIMVGKEPTYGIFGAPVNYALRRRLEVDDQTLQLGFTADRSDHLVFGKVVDFLEKRGNVVLMDRYLASTIAYGYASGLNIDWLIALQSKFVLPDLMFFLDTSVGECMERIEKRKLFITQKSDRFELERNLVGARAGYIRFADKFPGLVNRINGDDTISNVYNQITKIIEEHPKMKSV